MEENKDNQIQVNKMPAFTVLKNGSILKNIFLLRKQSAVDKSSQIQESGEEILLVGRHPHCHITLEHPSISRYHLRIHSNPCSQMLSVVDLSSVHGTWVSGRRIEPGVHVKLKEGDTVQMGGSSRVYELHWVPRSQAYDAVYTIKEGGDEEESNQGEKHEEYSSNDDLECSDLSSFNKIHDSPLKTLDPLISSVNNYSGSDTEVEHSGPLTGNENDDIFASVSIQAPPVVSETTSATRVSDNLNNSEDQLMTNCSKSSCDDTEVEHSSPWKTGKENGELFTTVCSQAPLIVSETTSATRVSDSLNNLEDQLMINCSKSSCDDTEVEHSSPWKTGNANDDILAPVSTQAPLVSESTSATQVSDTLNDSEDQLMINCSKSSCDDTEVEHSSPWKTGNANDDILAPVSTQAPLVSESTSATQVSDNLNDSEDQLMTNCSKYYCDDTEVEHTSPWKTGNANGELFTTVCIQSPLVASEDRSETEVSDCLNKSEDKLNWLRDNLSNEFDQISHGTTKDDLVSIDLLEAIETHEKDDSNQNRPSSIETDFDNANQEKINGSDEIRDVSCEFEQMNQMKMMEEAASMVLYDGADTSVNIESFDHQNIASINETDIDNDNQQEINNGSDEIRDVGCEFEQMNQMKMMDEPASMVLYDGVDTSINIESFDHEMMKKESVSVLPDVADMDEDKTFTPDTSKAKEIHMILPSAQKLSASMKLFDSLDAKELKFYTTDKENKNPNACSGKSLSKKPVNPIVFGEKDILSFSQISSASDEGMCTEQEVDPFVNCEEVLAEKESKSIQMIMEESCNSINYPQTVQKIIKSSQNLPKKRWTMIADTNSLLDPKSLKHMKLLEGIKGTRLFVPKIVVRELMDIKSQDNFFKRDTKKASLALKWIDECMMNTRWWIHMDDDGNETVHSSTAVPEALAIALRLCKEITDQKIIILSYDLTLKIKAMAEGIMCEAAEEFRESLVNPFSESFMWAGSSARGLTWSCVEDGDDIVRQKYHGFGLNGSDWFKGLKLLARVTTSQLAN